MYTADRFNANIIKISSTLYVKEAKQLYNMPFKGHVQETTPFIISIAEFYVLISGCYHDCLGDFENVWGEVQTV